MALAEGGDSWWIRGSLRSSCEYTQRCYRLRYDPWFDRWERVRTVYRQPVRAYREAILHYRTPQHDHRDDRRRCRDIFRTVGNQHLTVNGAKAEADKAWIQAIRFYYGEIFMSLEENARDVKYTCSRSSVGETLGQVFNRCEIEAKPCKAEKGGAQ